jgi:two-component system NtrC family response regulator
MMKPGRILVVDDDESLRRVTQVQLQQAGYAVEVANSGKQALEVLHNRSIDLVLTDLKMAGMSGLELLRSLQTEQPDTIVILMTAYGTIETAVEAVKAGAYDYITKPVNQEELFLLMDRALEHRALRREVQQLRSSLDEKFGFEAIIGRSNALMHVLDLAARAAQSDATVLIQGETGSGKELLAKAIHFNGHRRDGPFVQINCGAIPKDLLESELFGHVKGSFTGAVAHKKGKAEIANGGTLFLDEIGDLPPDLQVKVLRLIQCGGIEKIGATEPLEVNVRIIAATHRDLSRMMEEGGFRDDLYYRLAVIPLDVPPLRERREDLLELLRHFFAKNREKYGRLQLELPDALERYFCAYRWPGNVRELENVVERLVVLARGDSVTYDDLPTYLRKEEPAGSGVSTDLPAEGVSLEHVERDLILKALIKSNWNQTQAARYLDLSRKTLIYRMEKYEISRERYEAVKE